jgi:Ubiquitin carboxyl-terminal hydrolase
VYELSAVLMHLGKSAHGGHYITHIRDEITGKWWKFNDQNVSQIDVTDVGEPESDFDFSDSAITDSSSFGMKANKWINMVKKSKNLQSSNAYMLIYSRKDKPIFDHPSIPSPISLSIDQQNDHFYHLVYFSFSSFIDDDDDNDDGDDGYDDGDDGNDGYFDFRVRKEEMVIK